MSTGERRGDTRVLYPQPACIIPLKGGKVPLIAERSSVFLCDLSGLGISFFSTEPPRTDVVLLCLRDEADKQMGGKESVAFIKLRVRQAVPGEQGYTRTGCEIVEEVRPIGNFAMLPVAFASHPIATGSGANDEIPEAVQRMCLQR